VNASSDYQKLRAHLAFLRMTAAAEALPGELEHAIKASLTHAAFLERLLAVEAGAAGERRRASLERFASLPSPFTLADFDFSAQPSADPKLIADLGTLRFIDDIGNQRYENLRNALGCRWGCGGAGSGLGVCRWPWRVFSVSASLSLGVVSVVAVGARVVRVCVRVGSGDGRG
jgi:hypothetical protein